LQVVDLQKSEDFQALGVELLSIAPDTVQSWRDDGDQYGIQDYRTVLSDAENQVATRYDVMKWAAATGEPGHTFVLIDESRDSLLDTGLRRARERGNHVRRAGPTHPGVAGSPLVPDRDTPRLRQWLRVLPITSGRSKRSPVCWTSAGAPTSLSTMQEWLIVVAIVAIPVLLIWFFVSRRRRS
jgi:hypothetical protein